MPTVGEPTNSAGEPLQISAKDPLRLLESLPVPVFVTVDHRFIFVNEAQSRILGAPSAADVIGSRLDQFLVPEAREGFLRALDELGSNVGSSRTLAEKWLRADGRSLTIEYVMKSIAYEGKTAIEGVLRKVLMAQAPAPQQQRARPRRGWFRRREEEPEPMGMAALPLPQPAEIPGDPRFIQALEAIPDGVYLIDDKGVCQFVNRAAAEMLGYEAEELVGKRAHELLHYRSGSGEILSADECPIHGSAEIRHSEQEILWQRSGTPLTVRTTGTPLGGGGRVISFRPTQEPAPPRVDEAAIAAAVRAERAAAEEHLRDAVATERQRSQRVIEEAVATERQRSQRVMEEALATEGRAVEARLEEAISRERRAAQDGIATAVAAERTATKKAVKEAVAVERSSTESAVRDAARVAAERAAKVEQQAQGTLETSRAEAAAALAAAVATRRPSVSSARRATPRRLSARAACASWARSPGTPRWNRA